MIAELVEVGDKLIPSDILLTSANKDSLNNSKLDSKILSILQNLRSVSPKAKVNATVSKIQIFYNCELSEMSESLRELVIKYDKELVASKGYNGKVTSSYSIYSEPLADLKAEIKIYMDTPVNMGVGDKAIFGNQLKFTVGDVFDYDVKTESGAVVEAIFGRASIEARIVHSTDMHATTGSLLEYISKQAVDIYFN